MRTALKNRVDKLSRTLSEETYEIKIVRKLIFKENRELKEKVIDVRTATIRGKR